MGSLRGAIARQLWGKACRWAVRHKELVLDNPDSLTPMLVRMSLNEDMEFFGRKVTLPIDGMKAYKRWRRLSEGQAEGDTIRWIQESMRADAVFYDVGANVGCYSMVAGLNWPQARILAFEPEPNSFLQMCRWIHANSMAVEAYPLAILDRTSVDRFYVHEAFAAGLSDHQFGRTVAASGQGFDPQFSFGAAAFSIDDLVDRHGLPAPTHVKIDVDGLEDAVIRGMERTIAGQVLESVLVEVNRAGLGHEIRGTFERHGFRCNGAPTDAQMNNGWNLIFQRG